MSAGAGPYLFLAGAILAGAGLFLGPLHITLLLVMALAAPLLQVPRQKAWETQNDMLEFASLAAMPILLALLAVFWLAPTDMLSFSTVLQGLGGFFLALGIFHMLTKKHTLGLADRIEQQP
ncbi:MAG: hypothetical protein ACPGVK_08355 [Halocynthiibacter sp.]